MQHKFPSELYYTEGGEFDDQYFVLPRAHADSVMAGMARKYAACTDHNLVAGAAYVPVRYLEQWLKLEMDDVSQRADVPVEQYNAPFTLVRRDSQQPSAGIWCERGAPDRRACMRGAYPEEAWRWP